MSVYPTAYKNFTRRRDYTDTVLAAHINALQDEISAVQHALGVDPAAGTGPNGRYRRFDTVGHRLDATLVGDTQVVEAVAAAPYQVDQTLLGAITWNVSRTEESGGVLRGGRTTDAVGNGYLCLPNNGDGSWLVSVQGSGTATATGTAYIEVYEVRRQQTYHTEYYTETIQQTGTTTGTRAIVDWPPTPSLYEVRSRDYNYLANHPDSWRMTSIYSERDSGGIMWIRCVYPVHYETFCYTYTYPVTVTRSCLVSGLDVYADVKVSLRRDVVAGQPIGIVGHNLPYRADDGACLYLRTRGVQVPRIRLTALRVDHA